MKVNSTIKAIRERCPSFEDRVFGMASFAQMTPEALKALKPENLPACYVLCKDETAETDQRSENSYYQKITATIAIVCLVSNQVEVEEQISTDNRGQVAAERIEDLKQELFRALLSWSPIEKDPMAIYSYDRFDVLRITPAISVFELDLICTYEIAVNSTRQPDELEENTGKFNELNATVSDEFKGGIDVIGQGDKPDGQIDAQFKFKDLW